MDAGATSKAWAATAESLKHKSRIESACQAICSLASQSASRGAARKAVLKHGLLQAVFAVLSTVLGERKRQRDWRTTAFAARVSCVAAAAVEVLRVADLLQYNSLDAGDGTASSRSSSSSSSSTTDFSRQSRNSVASVNYEPVTAALWDQLLPRLAVALQDNAVLLEAAAGSGSSNTTTSMSSSSSAAAAVASLATVSTGLSLRLLQLSVAVATAVAGTKVKEQHISAVAPPALRLATAVLAAAATAAGQSTAAASVAACMQLVQVMTWLQFAAGNIPQVPGSPAHGNNSTVQRLRELQGSPHYVQLLLVMQAGYTQVLLQDLQAGASSSGGSSSDSGDIAAAPAAVSSLAPHQQLLQRLGLLPALLPLVAEALRRDPLSGGAAFGFSWTACAAAAALDQAVLSCAQPSSHSYGHSRADSTAVDPSAAQLQLAARVMPVPLLLVDTVSQFNRANGSGSKGGAFEGIVAAPVVLACLGLVASELNRAAEGGRSSLSMDVWDLPVQQLLQQAVECMQQLLGSGLVEGSGDRAAQQSSSSSSSSSSAGAARRGGSSSAREASEGSRSPGAVLASFEPWSSAQMFDAWLKFTAELSRLMPHCRFLDSEQQQAACRQLAQDLPPVLQQHLRLVLLPQLRAEDADTALKMWAAFMNSMLCLCWNEFSSSSSSILGSMVTGLVGSGSLAAAGCKEQQQLLGLLLSYVKGMLLLIQQPAGVPDASEAQQQQQQQQVYVAGSVKVLCECGRGLGGLIACLLHLLQQGRDQQPGAGLTATWQQGGGSCMPWLLLLARAMFASGKLLAAYAAYKVPDRAAAGNSSGTAAAAAVAAAAQKAATYALQKQLAANINAVVRNLDAARSTLHVVRVQAFGEQELVAGSSSDDSLQQSLLQLEAFAEDFEAASNSAGEVSRAAAGAAEAAAECRILRAPSTADEMRQCMGLREEPSTPAEQQRLEAASTLARCSQQVDAKLEELQQHVAPLAQQLQQWAASFCGQFALACCCNNAGCTNLLLPSEQALVGGKQCVCAGCRTARFCSEECQLAMWLHHKQLCKKLKRQQRGGGGSVDEPATPS
jgi:hypothetical protein